MTPTADLTTSETDFLRMIPTGYAWRIADRLSSGGRIVCGTPRARATAEWIREEMTHSVGLDQDDVVLEAFPLVGYGLDEATSEPSVGRTSLQVRTDTRWEAVPAAQVLKGRGTGPRGATAEIVDVGLGRQADFDAVDRLGIRGRIVLFTATDLLFYGAPVQVMAARRGAVGAIMHWPVAPEDALRLHTMMGVLPTVCITNRDAARIRRKLALGTVAVKLVVANEWDGRPRRTGWNVLGSVRGRECPEEKVYVTAHFDHWFTSAADDNAGLGSLLAIAKWIVDAGLRPRRTLVFAAFDAEELGGWGDTWYDWLVGSYSHIVRTLDGRVLHPGLPRKIVAMLNMDVVGTRGAEVVLESTPELIPFLRWVARRSSLQAAVPIHWVRSPTSYDDWPFYQMGIPASQIAWWGPAYDPLYHSTADTMETIDSENLKLNIAFNGLGAIRLGQTRILPYRLQETLAGVSREVRSVRRTAARIRRRIDVSRIDRELDRCRTQVERLAKTSRTEGRNAGEINDVLRHAVEVLNPRLFVWDFTAPLPGWASVLFLSNPNSDLWHLGEAIRHLQRRGAARAQRALARVAAMQWGQFVDRGTYRELVRYIHPRGSPHALWGNALPPLTDVHREYASIGLKRVQGDSDYSAEIVSLAKKRDDLYAKMGPLIGDLERILGRTRNVLQSFGDASDPTHGGNTRGARSRVRKRVTLIP